MRRLVMLPVLVFLLVLQPGPRSGASSIFLKWCQSPNPELRMQAVRSLRGQTGPDIRAALLSMLSDRVPAVRAATRDLLARLPDASGAALAAEIARLKSATARREGLRVLVLRGQALDSFLADRDPAVRARALASGLVAPESARALLRDSDQLVRAFAIERAGVPAAVRERAECVRIATARVAADSAVVAALLRDRSWRVRLAAVFAAERLRRADLVPPLIAALEASRPGRVRARTAQALEHLTRAPFGEDATRWKQWWERQRADYRLPPPPPAGRRGHSAARVTFRNIPVQSRRLCFVLDASRSMSKPAPGGKGRTRWELVVRDLLAVLEKLPRDARLNVVLFQTEVVAWKPRLVPVSNRRACGKWIGSIRPRGWTNLHDAVAAAIADDDVDAIYVLTDGVPSRGRETARAAILDELAYLNHYRLVQINCVQAGGEKGLGKTWRGFLEQLARAHDGVSVRE
jgi:hypothetical protein